MMNKIRALLLLLAIFIAGYAIHSFISKFKAIPENIDFRISKEGVDVEIKKFKVIHEKSGRKDWELKADLAQINQEKETTKMRNVEYIFRNDENREFKVYADFGTLINKM